MFAGSGEAVMEGAIRSFDVAGLSLTMASAIALSPVVPPDRAAAVPLTVAASVNLTAAPDPIPFYGDLLAGTGANAAALLTRVVQDPAPILTNITNNQVAYVSGLGASVFAGFWTGLYAAAIAMFYGGGATLNQFLFAVPAFIGYYVSETAGQIGQAVAANLSAAAAQLPAAGSVVVGALTAPFLAGGEGIRLTVGDITEAVQTRDAVSLVRAVVDAPATVLNAFVNGRCAMASCAHPGLLTPDTGSVASVLNFRDSIAGAIKPFTGGPYSAQAAVSPKKSNVAPSSADSGRKSSASAHSRRGLH
jgi:hypothetical protein